MSNYLNAKAPDGQIYLCPACGRTAASRGAMSDTAYMATSCITHAILVIVSSIKRDAAGNIVGADAAPIEHLEIEGVE